MTATGKSKTCVWRWQERFMAQGVDGLLRDQSRPPGIAALKATHWTVRAMAKAVGIAASSVVAFSEKLHDEVGQYVSPPAHAIVLSVDEKGQIQALDSTQPGLPSSAGAVQP